MASMVRKRARPDWTLCSVDGSVNMDQCVIASDSYHCSCRCTHCLAMSSSPKRDRLYQNLDCTCWRERTFRSEVTWRILEHGTHKHVHIYALEICWMSEICSRCKSKSVVIRFRENTVDIYFFIWLLYASITIQTIN